ncbi:hypothetical protein DE146DRAFT_607321 [Phaeosphaeria sp. MPI-PUGE-AT-0046c]|nr:hypothetical protein DE146DRAFT_607321 [Phaeosphaeria sp. MPI-PUGE-AT-0046c]
MADAELGKSNREVSENQARPVKRSRTGCLTCRTRRRKCDEKRPVCHNCTIKGLDCRYAATIQFLGKNNYTPEVENQGEEVPRDETREQRRVELLNNDSVLAPTESVVTVRTHTDMLHTNGELVFQGTLLQSQTGHTTSPSRHEFSLNRSLALSGTEPTFVSPTHQVNSSEATIRRGVSTPDVEAITMNIDTPLGDAQAQHIWQTDSPVRVQISEEPGQGITVADFAIFRANSTDVVAYQHVPQMAGNEQADLDTTTLANRTWSRSSAEMPTDTNDMRLLKTYRYKIAPWLDMCDTSQPFGVMVLLASIESVRVRRSVLNLAQATENKIRIHTDTVDSDELGSSWHEPQMVVPPIFRLLQEVTMDLTNFWESKDIIQTGRDLLAMLLPQLDDAPPFAQAAYWLVMRLLLGCAFMATSPIRLPLPFLAHSRLPSTPDDDFTEFTRNAIALCVDTVMFAQGDDDRWLQHRYGLVRVEVWNTLLHGLGLWYRSRPQEFQPIIELYPKDGIQNEHGFPTIVFTSGAALLANQLYHTAMVLLLQHKPRFDTRTGSSSTSMSVLWHIHRICGIAINNDGTETWDTCLVASFIIAARNATHKSQQLAVLSALRNVQKLTGWSVLRHLDELSWE